MQKRELDKKTRGLNLRHSQSFWRRGTTVYAIQPLNTEL